MTKMPLGLKTAKKMTQILLKNGFLTGIEAKTHTSKIRRLRDSFFF
jgi:hypothetical protein